MNKEEVDFKFLFPDLIVHIPAIKNTQLLLHLKKSFQVCNYRPISTQEGYVYENGRQVRYDGVKVSILLGKNCFPGGIN